MFNINVTLDKSKSGNKAIRDKGLNYILDPRCKRTGSYKFGTVIVNASQWVNESLSQLVRFSRKRLQQI